MRAYSFDFDYFKFKKSHIIQRSLDKIRVHDHHRCDHRSRSLNPRKDLLKSLDGPSWPRDGDLDSRLANDFSGTESKIILSSCASPPPPSKRKRARCIVFSMPRTPSPLRPLNLASPSLFFLCRICALFSSVKATLIRVPCPLVRS